MNFLLPGLKDFVDIILVTIIIYRAILLVRKTGGYQILIGVSIVLILYFVATLFELHMISSILKVFRDFWLIALIILFQPEIRNIFARLGQRQLFSPLLKSKQKNRYHNLLTAISAMSFRRTGALIVFERKRKLDEYIGTGEVIDAEVSTKLILTIFNNKTILHDGAVIIRNDRIYAVKVVLPLSQKLDNTQKFGTRHLAAIGITEETDAFAIIISEENGKISFSIDGEIYQKLSIEELSQRISDAIKG